MNLTNFDTIDYDLVEDFWLDFRDHHQRSEQLILQLEQNAADRDAVRELFRSVHTIKGNLIYVGLAGISPILQSLEDVLDGLRQGQLQHSTALGDIILLTLDYSRKQVEDALNLGENFRLPGDFDPVCAAITSLATTPLATGPLATGPLATGPHSPGGSIDRCLELLDSQRQAAESTTHPVNDIFLQTLAEFQIQPCEDLEFVNQLVPSLEERSGFWKGKAHRCARLSLQINFRSNQLVDPTQLLMASLFHDLAMSFLPMELLHKSTELDSRQLGMMRDHTLLGSHLLENMGNWEEAVEIVHQHHERCDGSGYPHGLTGTQICNGAKILAIVDTFEACRFPRSYRRNESRPLLRAITQINQSSGDQFDKYWVGVFNQVMKAFYTRSSD